MSLSGNLSDFSVLETLQIIGIQKKTGTLEIESGRLSRELHFHEGRVLDCRPARPDRPDPFLEALVGLGRCDAASARRMRSLPAADADRAIREECSLDREGFLSLRALVLQGIVDAVLLWDRGRFRFSSHPVAPPDNGAWNMEQVLLESMRRLDEAAELKSGAFVLHGIPRRTGAPPSDDGNGSPAEAEVERTLLRLSNGRNTLQDLIRTTALAEYDVLSAARSLTARGLLQVEPRRRQATGPQLLIEHPRRLRSPLLPAALLLIAAACAGSGWIAGRLTHSETWPPVAHSLAERAEFDRHRALLHALELHLIRTGLYPASLEDLVAAGLWPEAERGWLADLRYTREAGGLDYTLLQARDRIQSAAEARSSSTASGRGAVGESGSS